MEKTNSFDSLVSEISKEERQSMLERMPDVSRAAQADAGDSFSPAEDIPEAKDVPISVQLKSESFIFRAYLWLKSVFTKSTPEVLFNEIKVSELVRSVGKNFPGLIDYRRQVVLAMFFDKISELKRACEFFRPYIATIEKDVGSFYVFLGSVVMPDVDSKINSSADPYSNPVSSVVRLGLRVDLLRNVEEAFQEIDANSKQRMYHAVKSVEWLRRFSKLPLARLSGLISENSSGCPFSKIENEIPTFATLFCSGFTLSDDILESIFLFSERASRFGSRSLEGDGRRSVEFMNQAKTAASAIHMFMSTVPMLSIGRIVLNDCRWLPDKFYGGEDWFARFKGSWKKIFDGRWEAWVLDCKKEGLRQSLFGHFALEHFPLLPNRPWRGANMRFRYELTGGFINWYLTEKFPKEYELALKDIMLEGTFRKKENQVEFTDSFNEMVQIALGVVALNTRLKPTGDVGLMFAKFNDSVAEDSIRSLQEQKKLEELVRSAESDMQTVIHRFGNAVRSLEAVLGGILGIRKDNKYDGIANFGRIHGRENSVWVATLTKARQSLESALNLIKELETIDVPQLLDYD